MDKGEGEVGFESRLVGHWSVGDSSILLLLLFLSLLLLFELLRGLPQLDPLNNGNRDFFFTTGLESSLKQDGPTVVLETIAVLSSVVLGTMVILSEAIAVVSSMAKILVNDGY